MTEINMEILQCDSILRILVDSTAIHQIYITVFPPNIAPPLFWTEKYILHTQILHFSFLKQHSLINTTLNMSLNNIECCFYQMYVTLWYTQI